MDASNPIPSVTFYEAHDKTLFSAVGLVVIAESRILLLKRQADRADPCVWGLPGGKLESGESSLDAIIRETFEETGILRTPSNLSHAGDFNVRHTHYTFKYSMFVTEFQQEPKVIVNVAEHSTFAWFPLEDAVQLELVPGTQECLEMARSHLPERPQDVLFDMPSPNLLSKSISKSDALVRKSIKPASRFDGDARYLVIIGPPGAGKTTLVKSLAKTVSPKWEPLIEGFAVDKESRQYKYLTRYLRGDSSWAFHCQIEAFAARFWQSRRPAGERNIADEWIYSTLAYCRALRAQGDLTEDEYQTLYLTYVSYELLLPLPSLVISLTASPAELRRRIVSRGRTIEKDSHRESYLSNLKVAFDSMTTDLSHAVPVVTIDSTELTRHQVLQLATRHIGSHEDRR